MRKLRNFKKDYLGFYAAEMQVAKAEARKFVKVAGVPFTINNARYKLLNAANCAMVYFYDDDADNPHCDEYKKEFNHLLGALPYKTLPDIAELIKVEILALLRLNFGDLAVGWLTREGA